MRYRQNPETDPHGQPIRLFRVNIENNTAKAIDQLSGICSGILADAVVTEQEAQFFADWVKKYSSYEPVWPFTDILTRVERIFADGRCDDEEREELKSIMQSLCGHREDAKAEETYSSTLPIDSPPPEVVVVPERVFVVTGKFAYGTRQKVMNAITVRGGVPSDSMPTRDTHYLVIGVFASRDWANTNFGRKIERAVKLRESRSGISIISEEHWKKFVA